MLLTRATSRARSFAAQKMPADTVSGRLLRQTARQLRLTPTRETERVINQFARLRPEATFIQIGANDGAALDPLHDAIARRQWTGIMVEPVPYVCERLRANMAGNPRVTIENVAIADAIGTKNFFHLAEAGEDDPVWAWYHALGSFDRDVLLSHRHLIPDIEDRVVTTPVDCVTFDALCARHRLSTVDVIQIDTEGYDHVILGQIDLERYQPQIVMYEHIHIDEAIQDDLIDRFHQRRYVTFGDDMDTVAVHADALDQHPALDQAVRRARKSLRKRAARTQRAVASPSMPIRALSPKRLIQLAIFRMGYKVQKLNAEERAAFVQLQRPDESALDRVFGASLTRLEELRQRYASVNSPATVHSIWAHRKSRANLTEIGWQGVDLTRFRASSSYVWNYGGTTAEAARLQNYVFAQAVRANDTAGLLATLTEDDAFGCSTFEFEGFGRVSRDLLDSVAEINFLDRHLGVLDQDGVRVIDIGAGYGRMAHRFLEANPKTAVYTCVDAVPESTFLAEFYLRFRGLADRTEVVPLDEVDERLAGRQYDLAINIHAFSECTYAAVEWWLEKVALLAIPHLMIVPNDEGKFLSTEPDGTRRDYLPLLTELGYEVVAEEHLLDRDARSLLGVTDQMFLFSRRL